MKTLVFLGSVRTSSPPGPVRLGARIAAACARQIAAAGVDAQVIDPLDYDLSPSFKPHFTYGPASVPDRLDELACLIDAADSYVAVSPEYNHSMSPALVHLLNHFDSSLFSFKPSAIVTYSAG